MCLGIPLDSLDIFRADIYIIRFSMKCPDSCNFLGKELSHHFLIVSTIADFFASKTEDTLIALVKAQLSVIQYCALIFFH